MAGGGPEQTGAGAQEGGLAGAVGTEHRNHRPSGDAIDTSRNTVVVA